jgi:hypothetical protein
MRYAPQRSHYFGTERVKPVQNGNAAMTNIAAFLSSRFFIRRNPFFAYSRQRYCNSLVFSRISSGRARIQ